MVVSAVGLAMAVVAARGDRARGRRRCGRCWYDMGGVEGLTCPECGRVARRELELGRTRRRKRLVVAAVLLVAAGQLGWLEGRVRRGGWLAAVPTEVLIVLIPQVPQEWLSRPRGSGGAIVDQTLLGRRERGVLTESQIRRAADQLSDRILGETVRDEAFADFLLLERFCFSEGSSFLCPVPTAARLHMIRVSIEAASVAPPTTRRGGYTVLSYVAELAIHRWYEADESTGIHGLRVLVDEMAPQLLEIVENGGGEVGEEGNAPGE